jgi:uncharacterized membrane protein/LysM repeat protein
VNQRRPSFITLNHDLAVVLGLSALLVASAYLLPFPALRVVLGAPFVLFFPGYSMVAALFPRRDDLEGLERLGLSLGLSIAVLPLMGLVLNYTPWGITLPSTLVSASSFMVGCTAVAYYRRSKLAGHERYAIRLKLDIAGWRSGGLVDRSLTVALALCILAAVGTFLFVLAKPEVGERFTEFYVLGPWGDARIYPQNILVGRPVSVIVGVVNREHEAVEYRIVRRVGDREEQQITGIQLAHDEKWEERLVFALQEPGDDQRLTFLLYKEGQEEPYRSLHLWIDVRAVGSPQPAETPSVLAPSTPAPSPTGEPSPSTAPAEAATATPSATPIPTQTPTGTPAVQVVHVVQPGENLSSIARQYGVTYQAIMDANGLEDPNLIDVGQELVIPAQ